MWEVCDADITLYSKWSKIIIIMMTVMLPVRSDCTEENPLSLLTTVLFQSDGMCERTLVLRTFIPMSFCVKAKQKTTANKGALMYGCTLGCIVCDPGFSVHLETGLVMFQERPSVCQRVINQRQREIDKPDH